MIFKNAPLIRLAQLWHIGTMQAQDKGSRGPSYEGRGLSVSLHPDEWEVIARLGGLPRWRLERPGAAFLDIHALTNNHRSAVREWAIANRWLEPRQRWEVTRFDNELGERVSTIFSSGPEAREEFNDLNDDNEGEPTYREILLDCPTPQMNARVGFTAPDINGFDLACTFLVEDTTNLDGVWWADRLAPEIHSAPRGVIVPRAIARWATHLEFDPTVSASMSR